MRSPAPVCRRSQRMLFRFATGYRYVTCQHRGPRASGTVRPALLLGACDSGYQMSRAWERHNRTSDHLRAATWVTGVCREELGKLRGVALLSKTWLTTRSEELNPSAVLRPRSNAFWRSSTRRSRMSIAAGPLPPGPPKGIRLKPPKEIRLKRRQ